MKICPFVSHMLGDDDSYSWTIEGDSVKKSKNDGDKSSNVVVLGYSEGGPEGDSDTMTDVATEKSTVSNVPPHLHCLKSACRFYQESTDDCQFDLMFSMLGERGNEDSFDPEEITRVISKQIKEIRDVQKENKWDPKKVTDSISKDLDKLFKQQKNNDWDPKGMTKDITKEIEKVWKFQKDNAMDPQQISKALSKDIDKIWKFQTKSVEELIKGFGESERSQTKNVENLKKDLENSIDILAAKMDKAPSGDLKKSLTALKKQIDQREQSIEDLSSTMSELVLNLHESITKLEERSSDGAKTMDDLTKSIPNEKAIKNWVEAAIDKRADDLKPVDLSGPMESLRREITAMRDAPANDGMEEKLESALAAQRELEDRTNAWQEKMSTWVRELKDQQINWDERLQAFADSQAEILGYLEDMKEPPAADQSRGGKKEARKFNNLGVTSFHNGAYDMARDQFLEAVRLDAEFAEAYNNLGLAYTELDEADEASDAFSRAIKLNPELHAAYNNLGYIRFKNGDYDRAIEMYNEALTRSTDNSSAYTNLGNAYFKLERIVDAREAWTKALEIDPGNEKAKRNLDRINEDAE